MVRGPLPSGRAPAHLSVLPGGAGAGGLDDLEDDRTTIEPAPTADEAPTPIAAASSIEEQWEDGTTVAEQSSTGTTSSKRGAVVEESTIEDQAKPLPPLHLVPPPQAPDPTSAAKLVVVGGPDQGRVFDLRSGSEVRIGRAVDNDVVLTDIAVSRKHLVLSWDGAAWVVHDNGSGNGTLINDRLEDGRCQLHHADRVEIGNTILRFDHLPSAHQPSIAGWGQRDEEAATVAGKAPVRASQVAAAATVEPPVRHRPASVTAPVRDRPSPPRKKPGATEPPPPPSSRPRAATTPPPPPRMTSPAAVVPPPSMSTGAPPPRVLTAPPSAPIPSTLTGAPSAPVPMPMSGPYTAPMAGPPMAAMTGPQFAPFGGGMRPMTTTAQVDPRPYGMAAPSAYAMSAAPRRRQRLWLGIGAVSLIAIVATGAVLGGGDSKPTTTAAGAGSGSADVPAPAPDQPGVLAAGVEPVPAPAAGTGSGSATAVVPPAPEVVPAPPTPEVAVTPTPAPLTPEVAVTPTPEPPAPEVAPTPAPPAPAVDRTPDRTPAVDRTPTRPVDRTPARTVARTTSPGRSLDIDTPTATNKPAAGSKALAAATKKADGQYRAKDWKGAAATLREAIGTSTEPEVKTMKARAADYEAIGTNLTAALGMSGARATEALSAYKKAMAADRRAGAAHQQFIRDKIADVAPNAAASYMVKQNYELAKSAADDAVNVGAGGNARIEGVRTSLERRAGEFYATAVKLQKSKPEDAKGLARRITKMVPASSPWYAKAIKLLNASSGRSDDDE